MARVTVEDCIEVINNRFELVLLAAQRARDISAGQALNVDRDNDKNPVVALREIADHKADLEELKAHIVRGVNRHTDSNTEDAALAALAQEGWPSLEGLEGIEASMTIEEMDFESTDKSASADEDSEDADLDESLEPTDDDIMAEAGEGEIEEDESL